MLTGKTPLKYETKSTEKVNKEKSLKYHKNAQKVRSKQRKNNYE